MRRPRPTLIAVFVLVILAGLPTVAAFAEAADGRQRLAGADRYGTAAAIALEAFPGGSRIVYLARGDVFADAVAAGSLTDGPVLLVRTEGAVPDATLAAIADLDPDEVIALGGPRAVSQAVLEGAAGGRRTGRVAGPDRYATAVAISRRAFPNGAASVFLAAGEIDPITAGSLTAGPILLLPQAHAFEQPIPDVVREEIARLAPRQFARVGGRVSIDVPWSLVDISGRDRIETSLAVALFGFGALGVPRVYLANADNPVDAVAAGALTDGPVLLTRGCGDLDARLRETVLRLDPVEVVGLGGPNAVCDQILAQLRGLTRPTLNSEVSTDRWLAGGWEPQAPGTGPTVYDRSELHGWSADGRHLIVRQTQMDGRLQLLRVNVATGAAESIVVPAPWLPDFDNKSDTIFLHGEQEPHASLAADGGTAFVPVRDGDRHRILAIDLETGSARIVADGRARLLRGEAAIVANRVIDLSDGTTWTVENLGDLVTVARDASWVADRATIHHRDGREEAIETQGDALVSLSDDLNRTISGQVVTDRSTGRSARLPDGLRVFAARFSSGGSRLLVGLDRAREFDNDTRPHNAFDRPAQSDEALWPGGPVVDADHRTLIMVDVDSALQRGGTIIDEDLTVVAGTATWPHVWWAEFDPTNEERYAYEATQAGSRAPLPGASIQLHQPSA